MTTRDLLAKLISFDTLTRNSNRALMDCIARWLQQQGVASQFISDADGGKANLNASVTPVKTADALNPGIVLSVHTDVVPLDGQSWTLPAFTITERESRYYGRGFVIFWLATAPTPARA